MTTEKDIVTKECIALDYKNTHFTYSEFYLILSIVIIVGITYMIFSITKFLVAFFILAPFVVGSYLLSFAVRMRAYIKIKQGNFRMERDVLVNAEGRSGIERIGPGYKANALYFHQYGKFLLREGSYYKWSENFSTTPDGIYNRSMINDVFMLVIIDKKNGCIGLQYPII